MTATVNTEQLEAKVKDMYRHVAQQPDGPFHVGYFFDRRPGCRRVGRRPRRRLGDRRVPRAFSTVSNRSICRGNPDDAAVKHSYHRPGVVERTTTSHR